MKERAVRFWSKGSIDNTRVVEARGEQSAISRAVRGMIHFCIYDRIDVIPHRFLGWILTTYCSECGQELTAENMWSEETCRICAVKLGLDDEGAIDQVIHETAEEIVEIIFADYVQGRGCQLDCHAEGYVATELKQFLKEAGKTWVENARKFGLQNHEIVEAILNDFVVT